MKSQEGSLTAAVVPRKPDAKTTAQSTLVNVSTTFLIYLFTFASHFVMSLFLRPEESSGSSLVLLKSTTFAPYQYFAVLI